jgi:hypothetical protein
MKKQQNHIIFFSGGKASLAAADASWIQCQSIDILPLGAEEETNK